MVGDKTTHSRVAGTTEWVAAERPPSPEKEDRLFVVRQIQAEGEPMHWSLVVGKDGARGGMVVQVKGDAIGMSHQHVQQAPIFASASFKDAFDLGVTINAAQREAIWKTAWQVPPPRAATQREVLENCQGWTVRLVQQLEYDHVINTGKVNSLKGMMEKVK